MKKNQAVPTVRVGGAKAIPQVLRDCGVDPAAVLREAGLDLKLFDNPDNPITFRGRGHLLKLCVARTGCDHFGLLVGQSGDLKDLGVIGYFVQNTQDVRTALRSIIRLFHLHAQGARLGLAMNGDQAVFSYDIYEPDVEGSEQTYDGAVAMMQNVMKSLCGKSWKPERVLLMRRRPEDLQPYQRCFRAPLSFDADMNGLVFSAACLDWKLSGADPELRRLLLKQIDALDASQNHDFISQLRGPLRAVLLTGHGTLEQTTGLFHMHGRTLSRRLAESGTNFRKLADECRIEIAREYLVNSSMDITQIAAALDYADNSAFTRAFRRWSGTTPSKWRAARSGAAR